MIPEIQIALLIIFACSIVVSILFQRIRQPSIVGFLLTGILVGPHAFRLLNGQEEIEQLAEIGVVLLLFIIGMEFSFRDLVKSRYEILAGGASQVVLTIGLGTGLALLVAIEWHAAIFIGFLICLSSTAIGLSLLQKSGNMASPLGRTSLAILIFQDIAVVPLMLLIPVLGGTAGQAGDPPLWLALGKGVAVVIVLLVLSRWVVPWAINRGRPAPQPGTVYSGAGGLVHCHKRSYHLGWPVHGSGRFYRRAYDRQFALQLSGYELYHPPARYFHQCVFCFHWHAAGYFLCI